MGGSRGAGPCREVRTWPAQAGFGSMDRGQGPGPRQGTEDRWMMLGGGGGQGGEEVCWALGGGGHYGLCVEGAPSPPGPLPLAGGGSVK